MQNLLDLLNNDTNLMVFVLGLAVWAVVLPRIVARFLLPYWGRLQPWVKMPLQLVFPQLKNLLRAEWAKLHWHLIRKVKATPDTTDDEFLAIADKLIERALDD